MRFKDKTYDSSQPRFVRTNWNIGEGTNYSRAEQQWNKSEAEAEQTLAGCQNVSRLITK